MEIKLKSIEIKLKSIEIKLKSIEISFIFSWHPLLYLYGVSMGFLWGAQHNFMKFLECFCDTSMGLQKVAYGISMGFLWDFEGFPVDS